MKVKFDNLLFIGIMMPIISAVMTYFIDIGLIVYSGIILSTILTFVCILSYKINKDQFFVFISTSLFCIYNFILLSLVFLKQGSINFLIPIFFLANVIQILLLSKNNNFEKYVNIYFISFFLIQFIFCILQYTYLTYGFGLKSNVDYEGMIAGTFGNSNDLATILVLFSIFLFINEDLNKKNRSILFFLTLILLLMAVSRFALLVFLIGIFIFYKGKILSKILFIFGSFGILYFIFSVIENYKSIGLEAVDRIVIRLKTIQDVVTDSGVSGDYSIDLRLNSYLYFLKNFQNIGFGTLQYGDYQNFGRYFNGSKDLIFKNPHSLIIEMAYWQGYLGLIFLSFMFFMWVGKSKQIFKILFIIIMISFIPSSVVMNLIFWEASFLLIFYARKIDEKEYKMNINVR